MIKNLYINYKINIDKLDNQYYNKGDEINIEIFTYKDYLNYKIIIEKRERTLLAEESEKYYLQIKKENEIKINNEHDKIFRKILNVKREAAHFINKSLNLTGEKVIKENQLEKYTNRFITDNLLDKESDVIYKIKGKNQFILIEHQTQIDFNMAIRMLEYSLGIIKSAIDYKQIANKSYEMPSVIPIVLYTGNRKWTARRSISEKQEILDGKSEFRSSKYNLVDVTNYKVEELIQEKTYISKAMLLEKHRTSEELIKYLKAIVEEIIENKDKYSKEAEEIFLIMIEKILKKKIGLQKVNEVLKKLKGVDEDMLTSLMTIEKENKKIFSNGRREGKLEIIKNMIKENLPLDFITKMTGISQKEIEKLKKK